MRPVSAFVLCLLLNVAIEVCRAGEGGLQTLQVTGVSENSATLHWDSSASRLAKGQLKVANGRTTILYWAKGCVSVPGPYRILQL